MVRHKHEGQSCTVGCQEQKCRPYEDAVALCVTFLDDASCAAGDAAGAALGDLQDRVRTQYH